MRRAATTTSGRVVHGLRHAASRKAKARQRLAAMSIALMASRMMPVRCFAFWPLSMVMTRSVRVVVA